MASVVTLYKFESAWNLPSFSHQCIQLEAYLRLFGVKFTEEKYTSANASPTGAFPALDIDGVLLGGEEEKDGAEALSSEGGVVSGIIGKLKQTGGLDLDRGLSSEDSADLEAYVALAESHLQTATLWAMWCDDQSYSEWTREFYSEIYPYPLSHIFSWKQRKAALSKMKHLNLTTEEQVLELVEKAYKSLLLKLSGKKYFFGRPTTLDAVVYAQLLYHKTSPMGRLIFGSTLSKYPALLKYVDGITTTHFNTSNSLRDPATIPEIKLKRKKKNKATPEERLFTHRRNIWLVTATTITIGFIAKTLLEQVDVTLVEDL